ncbi:hypothetical protein DIS24_g8406 [Lasiodiplodia hormozganensis]|uniref:Uncharacterized protein n=1 Tax=Lasiodiplodia hormozganensis TaxID=869390 RepID=A0AA39Y2W3_9PEZI|nr:hypothetical protein DIS24_g8406 [Lasiodiplodia hormozganensis]
MALIAASLIYSATTTTRYGSLGIGIYWDRDINERVNKVFLYLAVPMIDLFHLLAQITAYLMTPRSTSSSPSPSSLSLLHPAAALSGALISFCLWAYQVPIAAVMDYIGWEQPRDGTWNALAAARCAAGVAVWLLWTANAGFAAAAVHAWRRDRARVGRERAREEGRAQGWDEGRREAEAGGLELRGLGSTTGTNKVSGETMVDVELEGGGVGRKG